MREFDTIFTGCELCNHGFKIPLPKTGKICDCAWRELWNEISTGIGVPGKYKGVTDNDNYLKMLEGDESLLFHGKTGTGKTYMGIQTLKAWYEKTLQRDIILHRLPVHCDLCKGNGCIGCIDTGFQLQFLAPREGVVKPPNVRYVTCGDLRGSLSNWDKKESIINSMRNLDLLILDELGDGMHSESFTSDCMRIIDYRYSEEKPSIYISNLSTEDLQNWSPRIFSRLYECCFVEEITGNDRRMD